MFASQLAFSLDLQFIQQSDMPEFRQFIVASILTESEPGILLHSLHTSEDASGADYSSHFDLDCGEFEASPGYVNVVLMLVVFCLPCIIKLFPATPCLMQMGK